MPITITEQFKDLERPVEQNVLQDFNPLYGVVDYQEPDYLSNNVAFKGDARKLVTKLKDLFPDNNNVQVKLEQLYTEYFNTNYQAGQDANLQNIKDLKKYSQKLYFQIKAGLTKGKTIDDFTGYIMNLEFACLDGAVGKVIDMTDALTADPNKILFNAKYQYIEQLALNGLSTTDRNGEMAIHWGKQHVNYLKDAYKTELENQGDQYVDNQQFPQFAVDVHDKFKNGEAADVILEILTDKLMQILLSQESIQAVLGDDNASQSIENTINESFSNFMTEAQKEVADSLLAKDKEGKITGYKDSVRDLVKATMAEFMTSKGYITGAVLKFGENIEIIRSGNKFMAKDTGANYQILEQFSVNSLAEANEVADILQNLAEDFAAIKDAGVEKFKKTEAGQEIQQSITNPDDFKNDLIVAESPLNKLFEDVKKIVEKRIVEEKDVIQGMNMLCSSNGLKLGEVTYQLDNYPLEQYQNLAKIIIKKIDKDNYQDIAGIIDKEIDKGNKQLEDQYLTEQFPQDLLKETCKKLLDGKELDDNIKQQVKDYLETANSQEFSISKFQALTSYNVRKAYKAGVKFAELATVADDAAKFKALTSEYARYVYKAGATFNDLNELYGDGTNLIKFNSLTSFDAIYLYRAGVKFAELATVADDAAKFQALTSEYARYIYKAGATFNDLNELYGDGTNLIKFNSLTSFDAIYSYRAGVEELNFNALKDLNADKITALTSDEAIYSYRAGAKFSDLNELYGDGTNLIKFNSLTSDKAIYLYRAGAKFSDLNELYGDGTNLIKFNSLTSDEAIYLYRAGGAKFSDLNELYGDGTNLIKFNSLTSDEAIYSYRAGAKFSDLNELYGDGTNLIKFKLLTSYFAREVYKLKIDGEHIVKFTDLKDLDADKITALTSDEAIYSYRAGATFNELNELYGDGTNLIKFKLLTSYFAREVYKLKIDGEHIVKFTDLKDLDADKITALTSEYAREVYKAGVKVKFYQNEHEALKIYDITTSRQIVNIQNNFGNSDNYDNILIAFTIKTAIYNKSTINYFMPEIIKNNYITETISSYMPEDASNVNGLWLGVHLAANIAFVYQMSAVSLNTKLIAVVGNSSIFAGQLCVQYIANDMYINYAAHSKESASFSDYIYPAAIIVTQMGLAASGMWANSYHNPVVSKYMIDYAAASAGIGAAITIVKIHNPESYHEADVSWLSTLAGTVTAGIAATIEAMRMQEEYVSGSEVSKMHMVTKVFAITSAVVMVNEVTKAGIFIIYKTCNWLSGNEENAEQNINNEEYSDILNTGLQNQAITVGEEL